MQHFDQRPHQGSTNPYLIVSLQGGYNVAFPQICRTFSNFLQQWSVIAARVNAGRVNEP